MKYINTGKLRSREIGRPKSETEAWMEGWVEGWIESWREKTIKLLTRRLGQISQAAQRRINGLPLDKLDKLFDATFDFERKSDLTAWLREHASGQPVINGTRRQR